MTVATGGSSPAFARLVKADMEKRSHPGVGEFLEWLGTARKELLKTVEGTQRRQKLWRQAMKQEIMDLILQGRMEQAKDEVRKEISGAGAESSDSTGGDQGKI